MGSGNHLVRPNVSVQAQTIHQWERRRILFPRMQLAIFEDVARDERGGGHMKTSSAICAALAAMLLTQSPVIHAHWPDQPPHKIAHLGEFAFEGGGVIKDLRMSYVTHGKLNAAKDNAILFQHGFAANH